MKELFPYKGPRSIDFVFSKKDDDLWKRLLVRFAVSFFEGGVDGKSIGMVRRYSVVREARDTGLYDAAGQRVDIAALAGDTLFTTGDTASLLYPLPLKDRPSGLLVFGHEGPAENAALYSPMIAFSTGPHSVTTNGPALVHAFLDPVGFKAEEELKANHIRHAINDAARWEQYKRGVFRF